ncbi:MAG TPA: hypothetical protein VIT89_03270 [Solirubrobacterales bacterium]
MTTLPAGQRNAIYAEIRADLLGIDDLRLAVEQGELETADRLARRFASELRLVVDGLGWGDEVDEPVELAIPAVELRPILTDLRDRAIEQYEDGRGEQESFRAPWERAAQVRDACNTALANLPGS